MKNLRLQNKILLIIVCLITLLGVLLLGIVRPILFDKLAMELSEKGEFMTEHLAHMSSEVIIKKEIHQLQILLNDFMTDDNDLIYSFIKGSDGEIIAHSFTGGFPTALKNINRYNPDEEEHVQELVIDNLRVLDVAAPIMQGDLGEAHIGLSERIITESANTIVQTIFFIIFGMLGLGIVGAYFTARFIAKPLSELIGMTKEVGGGNLSKRAEIAGSDEIGQLGEAFNRMVDDLQNSTVSREKFRQQSEFLAEILESIPYPFYVINCHDYSIALANSATASKENWELTTCYALTHQGTEPCGKNGGCLCPMEEVRRTGKSVKVEHLHYSKEGEGRYFEVHGYPVLNEQGEVVQMIEYSMDINDRKQAEAKVLTSKVELERTNRVVEENSLKMQHALDGISSLIQKVIKKKELDVRFKNPDLPKCYEEMNCSKEECPCYKTTWSLRCWQVVGTFCGDKPQGSFAQKFDNCTSCPVFNKATDDPIYMIGEHFNNMMHILKLKTDELALAYTELKSTHSQLLQQEKMASVGQLAAGVAHEINNPTGFITSNLSSLGKYVDKLVDIIRDQKTILNGLDIENEGLEELRKKEKKLKIDFITEDIQDLIAESLDGANKIKNIVMNLKNFSRIDEANKYIMADINECLESTLTIAWNELKYKTTVIKDYGDIPQTKCYPMQLNQVFMNILVNAAQAIEKQGEIHIRTWSEDEKVCISISDSGSGIPEDIQHKIFEPFFTTKAVGKGTGLGMSIAYDIIFKKHQGDIRLESEVGKGTTFFVRLPIVDGDADQPEEEAA